MGLGVGVRVRVLPAPPHVPPHEAGQQTVPVAETEPSLQKAVSCGSGLPW